MGKIGYGLGWTIIGIFITLGIPGLTMKGYLTEVLGTVLIVVSLGGTSIMLLWMYGPWGKGLEVIRRRQVRKRAELVKKLGEGPMTVKIVKDGVAFIDTPPHGGIREHRKPARGEIVVIYNSAVWGGS